jgi:hypothetical protein
MPSKKHAARQSGNGVYLLLAPRRCRIPGRVDAQASVSVESARLGANLARATRKPGTGFEQCHGSGSSDHEDAPDELAAFSLSPESTIHSRETPVNFQEGDCLSGFGGCARSNRSRRLDGSV